jgi:phosphopantothenoylcysteine decarboxylase/phosphopantothenate--cysteine ligase
MLQGCRILVGVTGSIAAYKSASLIRLLKKAGAGVQVVMTPGSLSFITPLTLATLSQNPALHTFERDENGTWNNHVDLGLWADYFLICPATATTISKMAEGIADNLLLATYLSARCPVLFAPAMDLDMYRHPSIRDHIEILQKHGNILIPPGTGELASGLHGEGRMAEPEEIVSFLEDFIRARKPLLGKKALVTAGPTYEAIDPVRFIGNHSSGRMGIAIADALAKAGADTQLICGPSSISCEQRSVKRTNVVSADEMYTEVMKYSDHADYIVMAAAVADYTPENTSSEKIKKSDETLILKLRKTKDILATVGGSKKEGTILIGFALETENEEANARIKLERKNADFIVLNSLRDEGAGFGTLTNKIRIFGKNGFVRDFPSELKNKVAENIVECCILNR